ncbi:hypothetical protein AAIR98_001300 [Elusimicrobium simillimum]|uniref:hemagglutinin repeat-containing protein n=1 Tax=Elusimicrobium simillimum TaxID=3143438 RepID=UPI003C6F8271
MGAHALTEGIWKKNYEKSSETHIGSLIEGGSDINIAAGNAFTLAGSTLAADNNITVDANDINILSNVDSTHYYKYEKTKKSFGRSKIKEDRLDTSTHVGSNMLAGGDMTLNAANDITVLASALATGTGTMTLDAANNINILAGVNEEASLTRREKTGFLGLSASKDIVYDNVKTLEAASAFSGDNIVMKSGADTTIFASDVGAQGDGNIETGGNFNLLAGKESEYHYEYHMKRSFDLVDTLVDVYKEVNSLTNVIDKAKDAADSGRYEVFNVSLGKETEDTLESYNETARAATLNFGGNLDINAAGDATIKGSEILVEGATNIEAENINILAQELESWNKETHTQKDLSISAGISNSYVNTGLAAKEVYDAGKAVEDAREALEKAKENPRITDYSDYETNLAIATANLAITVKAGYNAAKDMVGSAVNSLGTGMQADVGLEASVSTQKSEATAESNYGSTIYGVGDINLTSRADISQKGSAVIGENDVTYNAGKDITIEASADTYNERGSHESYTAGVGMNTGGGISLNYGQQKGNNTSTSVTYNNSTTLAGGTLELTSGGDTTLSGANAHGADVVVNTGGTLTVESLQDEHHSNNSSTGFNAGISFTGASEKQVPTSKTGETVTQHTKAGQTISGGYNQSSGYQDSAWVNNQTGITGSQSVEVTADAINIVGGLDAKI